MVLGITLGLLACRPTSRTEVILYASQDQVYAEPLLRRFTQRTGIEVRAIYDSEAVKSVGLANRLLSESPSPRADVYWSNDELRTRQLAAAGVFAETNGWASFGRRSRQWVIRTESRAQLPSPPSLLDLTNASWRGRFTLASPLFGSTATHFSVLRQIWGEPAWKRWIAALLANQPLVVEGNSLVVRMVARGQAVIGLTDSDDIAAAQREGLPVQGLPLPTAGWNLRNGVGLIRGAPHLIPGRALVDFLLSSEALQALQEVNALERETEEPGQATEVDWERLLRELPATSEHLRVSFLR